ncbi:hypothetical protein RYX36_023066, partial [Vicia faba]
MENKVLKRSEAEEEIFSDESIRSRIIFFLPLKDSSKLTLCSDCHEHKKPADIASNPHCEHMFSIDWPANRKTLLGARARDFVNFVSRTLLLIDNNRSSRPLEKYSIVINNKWEDELLNTWISSILNGMKFYITNCTRSPGVDLTLQAPLLELIFIQQDNEFCNLSHNDDLLWSEDNEFYKLSYKNTNEIYWNKCNMSESIPKRIPFALLRHHQFNQVKSMKLEGLDLDLEVLINDNTSESNLSQLQLDSLTVQIVMGLLKNSPILETLIVK